VGNLANGVDVTATVSARNDAYPALATWNSTQASGHPYGPAKAGAIQADGTDAAGTVTVSWKPFDGQGDPIVGYYVQRLTDAAVPSGAQACSVTGPAPGTLAPPTPGGVVAEQARVDGGQTSYTFRGLTGDDTDYYFLVWGFNRAGCAHAPVAHVLMRPAPGAATVTSSRMEQRADAWDYHVTAVTPGFSSYRIRPAGAADAAGTEFAGTGWPREVLQLPFGEAVRFEIQGCASWGACGPWSAVAAPEPALSFTVSDLHYDAGSGVFSWTNGPSNGSLTAGYRCSAGADPAQTGTATDPARTCRAPAAAGATGHLTVTVNSREFTYDVPADNESEPR
jgi:hypothetical protein